MIHFKQTTSYFSTAEHVFLQGADSQTTKYRIITQGRRIAFLHALGST